MFIFTLNILFSPSFETILTRNSILQKIKLIKRYLIFGKSRENGNDEKMNLGQTC